MDNCQKLIQHKNTDLNVKKLNLYFSGVAKLSLNPQFVLEK